MNDTPKHIKELQLKIWLSKTPGERLKQFLIDNEDFFYLVNEMKKNLKKNDESQAQRKDNQ